MEQWRNDIGRVKPKHSYRNLSECHFVHHKFHRDWPGIEPVPQRCQAVDWPPEPRYGLGLKATEMSPVADWKEQAHQIRRWLSQVHQEAFSMSAPTAKCRRTEFRHPPATSSSDRVMDTSGMLHIERCAVFWHAAHRAMCRVCVESLQIGWYTLLYCVIWWQWQQCWSEYDVVLIGILLPAFRSGIMPPSSGWRKNCFNFTTKCNSHSV